MKSKTKTRKINISKANANTDSIVTHQSAFNRKGITLISLVITIVVLLILATVAISMAVDSDGLFTRARKAAEDWNESVADESTAIENALLIMNQIETDGTVGTDKKVNKPNAPVMLGMKKVMFKEPTGTEKGKAIVEGEDGFSEANWYNYEQKEWANAQTNDGSLWVWIPRFAYKINGEKSDPPIDIVFLEGTGDTYYDEEGVQKTAKRASDLKDGEVADTKSDYYVHPAFTDESNLTELGGTYTNYENGGWDSELTGIWVAKFEAGFASGNNNATPSYTNLTYTQSDAMIGGSENGERTDTNNPTVANAARNWLQGVYGANNGTTKISYPVFMGTTYSMNYINHNDAYLLCKEISKSGNPYGLPETAYSHLMKDSEWGAVAYLAKSKYGLGSTDIYINNISLDSNGKTRTSNNGKTGVESVYAVTGLTGGTTDGEQITIKAGEGGQAITKINELTENTPATVTTRDSKEGEIYRWDQQTGTGASCTGTIYGIYDMSGGTWERMAAYTNNGNSNLTNYGASLVNETDRKYTMIYPNDASVDKTGGNLDNVSVANYKKNTRIFGDAIRETSTAGNGTTSWYGDYSYFVGFDFPFSIRSGRWTHRGGAGLFCFTRDNGGTNFFYGGFRAVVVGA